MNHLHSLPAAIRHYSVRSNNLHHRPPSLSCADAGRSIPIHSFMLALPMPVSNSHYSPLLLTDSCLLFFGVLYNNLKKSFTHTTKLTPCSPTPWLQLVGCSVYRRRHRLKLTEILTIEVNTPTKPLPVQESVLTLPKRQSSFPRMVMILSNVHAFWAQRVSYNSISRSFINLIALKAILSYGQTYAPWAL